MKSLRYQMSYEGYIYASYKNKILYKEETENCWKTYLTIPELNFLNNFDLYNRLLREGIHDFYKINKEYDLIILKGKMNFYKKKKLVNTLSIENGSRPLRNGVVLRDNHVIYSEYHGNKNREPIHVYKYDYINNVRDILYTFNDIRHIHFIQESIHDSSKLYIGTGDLDEECRIYIFDLKRKSITKIGGGSQLWRAVSILQKDNYLFWGTDDPIGQNFLIRYDLNKKELLKVMKIDGPAYYSVQNKKREMFIATTIENRKRHRALIYKSDNGQRWDIHQEFKKDIFNCKYFGYGLIEFIRNQEELKTLYYNLRGLT